MLAQFTNAALGRPGRIAGLQPSQRQDGLRKDFKMMFWEFVLEDKALGRALDAAASMFDSSSNSNWSSNTNDPFGF